MVSLSVNSRLTPISLKVSCCKFNSQAETQGGVPRFLLVQVLLYGRKLWSVVSCKYGEDPSLVLFILIYVLFIIRLLL